MGIGILAAAPSLSSGEYVFTSYYNATGFRGQSYVCAIGLLMGMYGFSGYGEILCEHVYVHLM